MPPGIGPNASVQLSEVATAASTSSILVPARYTSADYPDLPPGSCKLVNRYHWQFGVAYRQKPNTTAFALPRVRTRQAELASTSGIAGIVIHVHVEISVKRAGRDDREARCVVRNLVSPGRSQVFEETAREVVVDIRDTQQA